MLSNSHFTPSNLSCCTCYSAALAILAGSCLGCTPAGPSRQAVSGAVTLDGKAISGVNIVFSPTAEHQLGAAVAVLDGRFELDDSIGPSEGNFDVSFDTIEPDLEDFEQLREDGKQPFSSLKIHPRYRKAGAASVKVESGRDNSFQFELRSR